MDKKKLTKDQLNSLLRVIFESSPEGPVKKGRMPDGGFVISKNKALITDLEEQGIYAMFHLIISKESSVRNMKYYGIFIGYFDLKKGIPTQTIKIWSLEPPIPLPINNLEQATEMLRSYNIW